MTMLLFLHPTVGWLAKIPITLIDRGMGQVSKPVSEAGV